MVGLERIGIVSSTKIGLGRIRTTSPAEVGLVLVVALGELWPQRVMASSELWPRASRGLGRVIVRCARQPKASTVGAAMEENIPRTERN
jgi:hypothetical protein